MADLNERHADAQRELGNVKRMGIIDAWWVEGNLYYVRRSPGAADTKLGDIGHLEAFLVGCWSTMNGLRRRQSAR